LCYSFLIVCPDVVYDCMHYAYGFLASCKHVRLSTVFFRSLHHTMLPSYMREMKKYHLAHHYKNFELGFGVTSCVLLFQRCHSSDCLIVLLQARYGTLSLTPRSPFERFSNHYTLFFVIYDGPHSCI
jgi:hypothetical protein